MTIPYKPSRLFATASQKSFTPTIQNTPPLPAIDWSQVGQSAPKVLTSSSTVLPKADAVVITWAAAEWAALEHVFCTSTEAMPYTDRTTSSWSGWTKYAQNLPAGAPSDWDFWGEWRLVQIGAKVVLLFKSNTHLDWPGATFLADLIQLLIKDVAPTLILSIGTAGGAETGDHIGTVRAVSAGTLYEKGVAPGSWPVYKNAWQAANTILDNANFAKLLFPIPTTAADLQSLATQFNQYYKTDYSLADLDPDGLNSGDPTPKIANQSGGAISLLTTPTFVVGTTSGQYGSYVCIEMDDAVIGRVAQSAGVSFGFVRNVSDPVQNAALPTTIQGNWGSAIYDVYGFYTSYNGALAAWAFLAASS
jgi:nucleoside phosphorylase